MLKNQGLITTKSNGGSEWLSSRSDLNGKGRTREKEPRNFLPDKAAVSPQQTKFAGFLMILESSNVSV